jgi:MarR family transcriptional regulator, transcriptional regulator for hemolysin
MPLPPKDARARFAPLVAHVSREWRRAMDGRLQAYGLTEATWLPLLRIARSETPMRQNELAASLSLDGSSVVRLLDALESSGLVERCEDVADRRAKRPRADAERSIRSSAYRRTFATLSSARCRTRI